MEKRNLFKVMAVISPMVISAMFSVSANAALIKLEELSDTQLQEMTATGQTHEKQAEREEVTSNLLTPEQIKQRSNEFRKLQAESRQLRQDQQDQDNAEFMDSVKQDLKSQTADLDFSMPEIPTPVVNIPAPSLPAQGNDLIADAVDNGIDNALESDQPKPAQDLVLLLPEQDSENQADETLVVDVADTQDLENQTDETLVVDVADTKDSENQNDETLVVDVADTQDSENQTDETLVVDVADTQDLENQNDETLVVDVADTQALENQNDESLVVDVADTQDLENQNDGILNPELVDSGEVIIADTDETDDSVTREPGTLSTPERIASKAQTLADLLSERVNAAAESEELITAEELTELQGELAIAQSNFTGAQETIGLLIEELNLADTKASELQTQLTKVSESLETTEKALAELKEKQKKHDKEIKDKDAEIAKLEEDAKEYEEKETSYQDTIDERETVICSVRDQYAELEDEYNKINNSSSNQIMLQMAQMMQSITQTQNMMLQMMQGFSPQIRVHNGLDGNFAQQHLGQNTNARLGLDLVSLSDFFQNGSGRALNYNVYNVGGNFYGGEYAANGDNGNSYTMTPFRRENMQMPNQQMQGSMPQEFAMERPFAFNFSGNSVMKGDRFGQLNSQNSMQHQQRMNEARGNMSMPQTAPTPSLPNTMSSEQAVLQQA